MGSMPVQAAAAILCATLCVDAASQAHAQNAYYQGKRLTILRTTAID